MRVLAEAGYALARTQATFADATNALEQAKQLTEPGHD